MVMREDVRSMGKNFDSLKEILRLLSKYVDRSTMTQEPYSSMIREMMAIEVEEGMAEMVESYLERGLSRLR